MDHNIFLYSSKFPEYWQTDLDTPEGKENKKVLTLNGLSFEYLFLGDSEYLQISICNEYINILNTETNSQLNNGETFH